MAVPLSEKAPLRGGLEGKYIAFRVLVMKFILEGKKRKEKTRAADMAHYPDDLCFDGNVRL